MVSVKNNKEYFMVSVKDKPLFIEMFRNRTNKYVKIVLKNAIKSYYVSRNISENLKI